MADLTPPACATAVAAVAVGGSTPSQPAPSQPAQTQPSTTQPSSGGGGKHSSSGHPSSHSGQPQHHSGSKHPAGQGNGNPQAQTQRSRKRAKKHAQSNAGSGSGSGAQATPTFFSALPGPTSVTGVPNFVIDKFDIPIFLLPIYQAAGIQYGVRWEVLAAINEIETDYGRNLNVSSAGAEGWMQFMPSTWKTWGVDANRDKQARPLQPGRRDLRRRALPQGGRRARRDLRKAIFAYNHADWYVDTVMLRARVFAAYPPDFVGSLTGLTEARFPVAARAKYADAITKPTTKNVKAGPTPRTSSSSTPTRRSIDIFAKQGSPVVAANDGIVKRSAARARAAATWFSRTCTATATRTRSSARSAGLPGAEAAVAAGQDLGPGRRRQRRAAEGPDAELPRLRRHAAAACSAAHEAAPETPAGTRQAGDAPGALAPPPRRSPTRRACSRTRSARSRAQAGGLEQVFDRQTAAATARPSTATSRGVIRLSRKDATLKPLEAAARASIGGHDPRPYRRPTPKASRAHAPSRSSRPARARRNIDPKPILDGWKLLASTNIYGASGKDALYGDSASSSIGQVLLLPEGSAPAAASCTTRG